MTSLSLDVKGGVFCKIDYSRFDNIILESRGNDKCLYNIQGGFDVMVVGLQK